MCSRLHAHADALMHTNASNFTLVLVTDVFHSSCSIYSNLCVLHLFEIWRVQWDSTSKPILLVWQGRGRAFSLLLQVQSGREIAGDGEAEGNILKKVFEAAGCSSVSDRFGCVLTLQLVTQTTESRVSRAQLTWRGSVDWMVRFCSLSV